MAPGSELDAALEAVWLTARLAAITTLILAVLGTPLAWWLATTRSRARAVVEAITALPLVLPPTVMGFYLLLMFGPQTAFGRFWIETTGSTLNFSFTGLVVASVLYSLPFTVQPLQGAFAAVGRGPMEAAAVLGARPRDAFFTVALPLAARGYLTAAVLTFAHTVGEFGVVLMVGGNIPGETRVIAIEIYERVETLDYATAHALSLGLVAFAFVTLVLVYATGSARRVGV